MEGGGGARAKVVAWADKGLERLERPGRGTVPGRDLRLSFCDSTMNPALSSGRKQLPCLRPAVARAYPLLPL